MGAALVAPVAAFLAVSGDTHLGHKPVERTDVIAAAAVAPVPAQLRPDTPISVVPAGAVTASQWRTVPSRLIEALPAGRASERGLQVNTIMAARAVSAAFPEILTIGGVRPDALKWHPHGLAIDVMIPDPSSAHGIELGNQIVSFVLDNAERLGLENMIWRGTLYYPSGPAGSAAGHYDHVHIATTGGGYPTGGETYYR